MSDSPTEGTPERELTEAQKEWLEIRAQRRRDRPDLVSTPVPELTPQQREAWERRKGLEAAFRTKFGYRPMRSLRMARAGTSYEGALAEAISTGDSRGIMDADWHAKMRQSGWHID